MYLFIIVCVCVIFKGNLKFLKSQIEFNLQPVLVFLVFPATLNFLLNDLFTTS